VSQARPATTRSARSSTSSATVSYVLSSDELLERCELRRSITALWDASHEFRQSLRDVDSMHEPTRVGSVAVHEHGLQRCWMLHAALVIHASWCRICWRVMQLEGAAAAELWPALLTNCTQLRCTFGREEPTVYASALQCSSSYIGLLLLVGRRRLLPELPSTTSNMMRVSIATASKSGSEARTPVAESGSSSDDTGGKSDHSSTTPELSSAGRYRQRGSWLLHAREAPERARRARQSACSTSACVMRVAVARACRASTSWAASSAAARAARAAATRRVGWRFKPRGIASWLWRVAGYDARVCV
jgi:hypothetical protein